MFDINARASIMRLANTLAPLVTNSVILGLAEQVGVLSLVTGSNKALKLEQLFVALLSDGRRRARAPDVIIELTMAAHSRALQKLVEMSEQQVDDIVAEMRFLGISTGKLGRKEWRRGLTPLPPKSTAVSTHPAAASLAALEVRPKRHEAALQHLIALSQDDSNPQVRGRQLEVILFGVLKEERLDPARNVVNLGEELDVVFTLGELHYVSECKWERRQVGFPQVRLLADKARTKIEGTFGVVLSMSGFVDDINEKVAMGSRQNSVGLDSGHFMAVLEGRMTWSQVVRDARKLASRHTGVFYRRFGE